MQTPQPWPMAAGIITRLDSCCGRTTLAAARLSNGGGTTKHSGATRANPRMHLSGNQGRALVAGVVCLALIGVLVVVLDWRNVRMSIAAADWRLVSAAVVTAFFSYACSTYSYALLNRSFGINLRPRTLLGIGFVSSTMITMIGGVAGHPLRLLLLVRRGVRAGDALAPSLFHGYLESLIFFFIIPAGLAYLAFRHTLPTPLAMAAGAGALALAVGFAAAALVIFVHPIRGRTLGFVGWVWRMVTRRRLARGLNDFEETLRHGLSSVTTRPVHLIAPVGLIVLDRASRVAVVWLCFEALGGGVAPEVVVTGFAIGVAAGVMSMVPGGLGVQEGSMAGVFHLLGAPLEQAVACHPAVPGGLLGYSLPGKPEPVLEGPPRQKAGGLAGGLGRP